MIAVARGLEVVKPYAYTLGKYLAGASEVTLQEAYEIGRRACAEGLGVLDVARVHNEALTAQLRRTRTPEEGARLAERAETFLAECLSPFEMTHRGYRDALARLGEVNERLEQRVVELQQARAEAEAAVRLRDEFLSVAAHELKTPITGLQLAVQHLMRRLDKGATPEPDRLRQALLAVNQQSEKTSRLVAHLLETSRLEAGRLALDLQVENLTRLVTGVVEQARAWTNRHELVLSAPPEVLASIDALRMEQVVSNLLNNAIKFSPKGGRIDVEVSAPDDASVRLAVRDRGLGIPPEHRAQIFDRFHQAHARDHRSGLGLGLYVSRAIVELHGGSIWAEFPPDGGTRFVVTLPASPSPSPLGRVQR
jgi:signal transduction histidine kinase